MDNPYKHPPSQLIQTLLVSEGLFTNPEDDKDWGCYISFFPETQAGAKVGCVFDTSSVKNGRIMRTGEVIEHPGLQIAIRTPDYATGWAKMSDIRFYLDRLLLDKEVIIENTKYNIHSATRTSDILSLGVEQLSASGGKAKRRDLFSLNFTITLNII